MRWTSKLAPGLFALALFSGCQVLSLRIIGKDEGKIRTEDFAGVWISMDSGRASDTVVFSGLTARPAVLLSRSCAGADSAVIELTSSHGLNFLNLIELHPKKEEYAWAAFDRVGDTIRMHIPRSAFFAEAVKKGELRGKVDSGGSVLLTAKSENVVAFLRRNRGTQGLFDERRRSQLVRSPGGCPVR